MVGARWPEGRAGHHGHSLLAKELPGKRLVIHAGAADLREAVEGAARLEAEEPDLVEPPGHELATAVVLGLHLEHEALARAERLDGRELGGSGSAHDPVLVHLGDAGHQLRRRRHVADAPAGHRVALREAADQDRPIPHPGK